MRTWIVALCGLAGAGAGVLVALSRDRAPPPEDARPSVGRELDADAPGPSLVGVPDEPVAP
ncbi:MAG: hypothetical protein AB7I45_18060, partial [Planctomycetota bacterium]